MDSCLRRNDETDKRKVRVKGRPYKVGERHNRSLIAALATGI